MRLCMQAPHAPAHRSEETRSLVEGKAAGRILRTLLRPLCDLVVGAHGSGAARWGSGKLPLLSAIDERFLPELAS